MDSPVDILVQALEWLQRHPQLSGLLFVILVAAVMAVGIPGGNVLLLTSGLLFGAVGGALLTTLGLIIGAVLTHIAIRSAFGRWLERRAADSRWLQVGMRLRDRPLLLIAPRFVPIIPFFVLNVAYALAGVRRSTFAWTTAVGLLPVAFLFAHVGSQFNDIDQLRQVSIASLLLSPGVLLPLAGLVLLSLGGWWLLSRPAREA